MPRQLDQDGVTVVELDQEYAALHHEALEQLDQLLARVVQEQNPPCLLLDASATRFVDSNFLEVLIRYWKRICQKGGQLALCSLSPECREVFRATRLHTLWPIYDDRNQALEQFPHASQ